MRIFPVTVIVTNIDVTLKFSDSTSNTQNTSNTHYIKKLSTLYKVIIFCIVLINH